jgi:uncharacterized membrane protein
MRRGLWFLILILFLALGLRLIALSSRTLWYDEAFAVLFSEKGLNAMLYGTLTPAGGAAADVHPLLYYTTLDVWMRVFGQSPVAVRMYSVLLGVMTVGMLYLLANELFGERTALAAAFIAAVAPFEVQYSQETRMYALLGLLLVSATWCFVRGWRTRRIGYWIAFGVLAGLAMYAQQLAAFYLAALGSVPILARRRDQMMRLALGAAIALIIYLPWLVNLPSQLGKLGSYWILKPSAIQPLVTVWSFIFAELPVTGPLILIVSMLTLVLLGVLLIYRVWETIRRHLSESTPLAFVLYLSVVPIALMWLVSQWRPVYLTRALLPSALMLYVVLAWLVTRAQLPRLLIGIIAVPWALTILLGLYTHYTWNTFPRPPFDSADQFIASNWQNGDHVVHANKITMLPMVYYNRGLTQAYIRDIPGSGEDTLAYPTQQSLGLFADECAATAAKASPRVWFVIFSEQVTQQNGQSTELTWFDAHYHRQSMQPFNDLLVYLYDQPDAVAKRGVCQEQSF